MTSGEESGNQVPKSFSASGQLLAFHHNNPSTRRDVYVLQLADRQVVPFLRTPFTEGAPEFSPDGRWIAYVSDESGRPEIFVQPYPGPGGKRQISTEGGTEPVWRLFPLTGTAYDVSADGQRFLMVKDVDEASAATQINVVLNWFEELKRRVPAN